MTTYAKLEPGMTFRQGRDVWTVVTTPRRRTHSLVDFHAKRHSDPSRVMLTAWHADEKVELGE